jgi:uncharacterized protein YbbC (DUF1343 family)
LAAALHNLYPQQWRLEKMMDILVSQAVFDAIAQGQDPRRIAQDWQEKLQEFIKIREKYIIYK